MVNSREITDIKSITVSSKSCKFNDSGCTLENKFGKLTLSIPDLTNVMVVIKAKKVSGNGRISINGKTYIVQSKTDELQVSPHDKVLEIQRPQDATGEVAILGATVYHNNEGEELKRKWKTLIARCGEYKSIRMVEDRLYASIGACFVNGSTIKSIQTNPPDMAYMDEGVMKFHGSCEITDIVVNDSVVSSGPLTPEFIHRDVPTPVVAPPPPLTPNPLVTRPSIMNVIHIQAASPPTPAPKQDPILLYDSIAAKEFDITRHGMNKSKTSKFLKSNGRDYLVLKRGGSYTFPVSFVRPNSEYTVVVASKKLNGNGRLQIGFINEGNAKYPSDVFVVDDVEKERLVKIRTTSLDGMPRFSISMPDTSVGEILVKSVRIYGGSLSGIPNLDTTPFLSDVPSLIVDEVLDVVIDIRKKSRDAAIFDVQPNELYTYPEVFGYVEATSFNTKLWLSRVLGMFPNIQPIRLGISSYYAKNEPDITLTSLDTLKVSNRIWLEEFRTTPTDQQLALLNKASVILTPSLTNSIELKILFPQKRIEICSLAYPCISKKQDTRNHIMYFESDVKYTDLLIRSWKEGYPKLLVVGSNMRLLPTMKHVSEYELYTDLLNMVGGSQFVIELSTSNHFANGISDMCRALSVPVITNNHHYLTKNGYRVIRPSVDNLRFEIESLLNTSSITPGQVDENSSKENMLTLLGK